MSGIDFIFPDRPPEDHDLFNKISLALVAPQPYVVKNALSEHMSMAIENSLVYFTALMHVNRNTNKEFNCVSYYADDPYITASCAAHDDVYLATIGAPFVRRLVKICSRIGLVLPLRRRLDEVNLTPKLEQDEVLANLLEGNAEVSESEAQEIIAHWPAASTQSAQLELGEYALFYDLIRIIWVHEWAHALCGHVSFASSELHIAQLHEFSADRVGEQLINKLGYPRNEILQALEIHADEFAAKYCVREILWGADPIGDIAGPAIDLVDRLLIFNIACCVFAVMWTLAEQHFSPGISFHPPRELLTSDKPDPMFAAFKTTHPPAVLRYLRFRDFQRDITREYAQENNAPLFMSSVDAASLGFLDQILVSIDRHFFLLIDVTPMAATTPVMKRLESYEAHLLKIERKLTPWVTAMGFVPTLYDNDDKLDPQF